MQRIKQAKPSAALVVAVIALVAALGGGAVAGVAVTSLNKEGQEAGEEDRQEAGEEAGEQADRQEGTGPVGGSVQTAHSATIAESADTANGESR